ncbi:hypothetical protein HT031_005502 [Scenedesmus sp. PABB004]|nr:hypothetical protein HT031_005502 [Scenedesmus sp. PABB004]
MAKRERDESAVEAAVGELEAALARDADMKLKALVALVALVDFKDEGYAAQRQAAEAGALALLMQLLEDESDAVRVQAAKTLVAVTKHSTPARERLSAGKGLGFSQTPAKVALNPVQDEVTELDGAFNLLTNMRFSDDTEMQQAGAAALAAICALNRPNTLAALRELVHRLLQHEPKALLSLEDTLAGLDVRDDMAVLLDQALVPALSFLRNGSAGEKLDAVTLLGSICEKRPGAAAFLVAEGALPAATALLCAGDLSASDAAARSLWLLVKDNKRLLAPGKDGLGVPGTSLVEPLLGLVEAAEDQEDEEDAADGDAGDDDDDEPRGGAAGSAVVEAKVDNGDDALLLLRALAGQDPDVRDKLKGQSDVLGSRCAIM